MHYLHDAVDALIRSVSAEIVLPHFRTLSGDQIVEKEPGDLVTIADRLAEGALNTGLIAIAPYSTVVGEEAVDTDPTLLDRLNDDMVWIVDPIDGTGNFALGRGPFAIMVALARHGVVEAGWIYDPLTARMLHAALGLGAYVDRIRIDGRSTNGDLPVLTLGTRFLPTDLCAEFEKRAAGSMRLAPTPMCAGEQYPRLVLGENDVAIFWRTHPWDHAAGGLFLEEAGGRLARFDGSPYHIDSHDNGLIAAATPALWDLAAAQLLGQPTYTSIDQSS